jgi:hypothetical protein
MVREIERVLREELGADSLSAARALASAMGEKAKIQPLQSGGRPEGTLPAGPAARFAVRGWSGAISEAAAGSSEES